MRNRVAGEGEEGVIGCNYHQPINSEVEERGRGMGGGGGLKGNGRGGGVGVAWPLADRIV